MKKKFKVALNNWIRYFIVCFLLLLPQFIFFIFIEEKIGKLFGCTFEEGAVLISLYCYRQQGLIYSILEKISAISHFLYFPWLCLVTFLLLNPISLLIAFIYIFLESTDIHP